MAMAVVTPEGRAVSAPGEGRSDVTEPAEYAIGAQVYRADGACGELERAVVDPVKRAITHLVVKRRHDRDVGRLVQIKLV
jgi:hypothetical protein